MKPACTNPLVPIRKDPVRLAAISRIAAANRTYRARVDAIKILVELPDEWSIYDLTLETGWGTKKAKNRVWWWVNKLGIVERCGAIEEIYEDRAYVWKKRRIAAALYRRKK